MNLKLKIFQLHIVIISCFSPTYSSITDPDTLGNNFLPLQINNQWQFIKDHNASGIHHYSLNSIKISSDTLIDNRSYFLWDSKLIRYCDSTKDIFIWNNNSDKLYMDFNLSPPNVFVQFNGTTYRQVTVIESYINQFQQSFISKGFYFDSLNRWDRTRFGENIGFFYLEDGLFFMTGGYSVIKNNLIMAILYDSLGNPTYITEHHKPQFLIDPVLSIDTIKFELEFNVNHHYSRINLPPYPGSSLRFIDSVWMYSYYSNGDSVINLPILIPNEPSWSNLNYTVSFNLDTALLKNGYDFFYRFCAKDKGIIPEYSCSPDSGYYRCEWNETTTVKESTERLDFYLSQNYPNPFNPITVIGYQLPVSGNVTLKVFDVLGREVATLVNEYKEAGYHEVEFNPASPIGAGSIQYPASGVYFYQLRAGSFVETKKMLLLR